MTVAGFDCSLQAHTSQPALGSALPVREARQNFNVVDHETMGHGMALRRFKLTYREILRGNSHGLAKNRFGLKV